MNDFRERILSGEPLQPLVKQKRPKGARRQPAALTVAPADPDETLGDLVIPRETSRTANHRDGDRHRLLREDGAYASWQADRHEVRIINLSGGGAMIEAPFAPFLWDRVDLELGECGTIECAVRWLKNRRIGLEFAHETRIDADPATRDALLREVIARSFPHLQQQAPAAQPQPRDRAQAPAPDDQSRREAHRHPLIWSGQVLHNHERIAVRLRNISAIGALIDCKTPLQQGSELMLDLGEAGTIFADVCWQRGDQAGLKFQTPFELNRLSRAKPGLAPRRWTKPEYLRNESQTSSPWAAEWGRLSVEELQRTLRP